MTEALFKKRNYPVPDRHKQTVTEYLRVLQKKGIMSKQRNMSIGSGDEEKRENSYVPRGN